MAHLDLDAATMPLPKAVRLPAVSLSSLQPSNDDEVQQRHFSFKPDVCFAPPDAAARLTGQQSSTDLKRRFRYCDNEGPLAGYRSGTNERPCPNYACGR